VSRELAPLEPAIASALAGRRALITGGAGFLGTALLSRLQETGCSIRLLVRSPVSPAVVSAEVVEADARDARVWGRALAGVDLVFHLAAQTSAAEADADPSADFDASVRPLEQMLEQCRRDGVRTGVVLASAATIAGLADRPASDEHVADQPLTAYDLHKQMAESYLSWYVRRGIVDGASLRLTNVYGPGPCSRRPDRGVLNRAIAIALEGQPITVFRPVDRLRDYLYVDDAARAFLAAAARLPQLGGGAFVVGSGRGTSLLQAWQTVAQSAGRATGRTVSVLETEPPVPPSPIEARSFVADPRRFAALTGWTPRVGLAEGVGRTVQACLAAASQRGVAR
jgi:nucleoside-diphosphate-sugar epimerase